MVQVYAYLWVQTKWVCCGNHMGECWECPVLWQPGNIEWYDACALECDACSARIRADLERDMSEMTGLYEWENLEGIEVTPNEDGEEDDVEMGDGMQEDDGDEELEEVEGALRVCDCDECMKQVGEDWVDLKENVCDCPNCKRQ
jgi:hypothetical protein